MNKSSVWKKVSLVCLLMMVSGFTVIPSNSTAFVAANTPVSSITPTPSVGDDPISKNFEGVELIKKLEFSDFTGEKATDSPEGIVVEKDGRITSNDKVSIGQGFTTQFVFPSAGVYFIDFGYFRDFRILDLYIYLEELRLNTFNLGSTGELKFDKPFTFEPNKTYKLVEAMNADGKIKIVLWDVDQPENAVSTIYIGGDVWKNKKFNLVISSDYGAIHLTEVNLIKFKRFSKVTK